MTSTQFATKLLSKSCVIFVRVEAEPGENLDDLAGHFRAEGFEVIPEPLEHRIGVFRRGYRHAILYS